MVCITGPFKVVNRAALQVLVEKVVYLKGKVMNSGDKMLLAVKVIFSHK